MNPLLLKVATLSVRGALISGGVLTGIWYFFIFNDGGDLQSKISNLDKDIQVEKTKEKESETALKEIAATQAAVGALADQFRIVSAQLPTDNQMAEIIRTVDKVAQVSGLSVKTKEPKPSIRHSVVEILPLHVTAEGTFSEITTFFYYLSTIERIVRVRSFVMSAPLDLQKSTKVHLESDVVSYKFIGSEANK